MICQPMAANGNRLGAMTSYWPGLLRANRRIAPAPEPAACPAEGKTAIFGKI